MKKLITLFGVILMLMGTAIAQNCNFKVKFTVTAATCYNNGKVHYALVDENDDPIVMPATLGLDSVRIYYKVNESDSAHYNHFYAGGWDSLVIEDGTYIIGVEGICNCGTGCYTKVDTHLLMEIPTMYHTPVVESFSAIATTDQDIETSLGMRPTINCMNTGRVQLKIMDGSFPFTVDIVNQDTGEPLRTDTLFNRQYSGTNPRRYDYRDYYSFDSLPAGNWEFHVEDGCGYKMPIHTQEVTVVEFPKFNYIDYAYISAGENSYADVPGDQVVRVQVYINNNNNDYPSYRYTYNYQYFPQLVEYRLKYGDGNYTEWKPVPAPNYYYFYLYDTLHNVTYCELIDKIITLEYRDNCWGTTTTKDFKFKPNFSHSSENPTVSRGCTYDYTTKYHYTYTNSYYYNSIRTSIYTSSNELFQGNLVWVWTDTITNTIIKTDTIPYIQYTYLYDTLVEQLYRSFEDEPLTLGVRLELKSENCGTLYSTNRTITFSKNSKKAYWNLTSSYYSYGHCCKNERYVYVYSNYYNPALLEYDSTIVRLLRSPKNNLYNFEAIYDAHTKAWRRVTKAYLENPATITTNENGTSFEIRDNCLPSGVYEWEIITPCDTYRLNKQISFPDLYESYFVEEPSYTVVEECTRAYINYTAGKVGYHRYNTSYRTGNDTIVPDYIPPQTYFKVIKCPSGGADQNLHTLNDPINISMPGRYIVKYYTSNGNDSARYFCEPIYDTIDYAPASTVSFDYAIALQCDPLSTLGTVYVGGSNGSEPYTYTLYQNANKQGAVLGINNTGIFENIPMSPTNEFSCSVQDSCGAAFWINLKPKTWTELQKVWFDGGMTITSTCEGSTICVNALSIGSILRYEWSGPDGFTDTVSRSCVFIPRGGHEGWYKVHIYHSGCIDDYYDSIYLNIKKAPWVTLSADTTVCPGAPTEVELVPHSPNPADSISMTVAFENIHETITRNFKIKSGDTARYTITPLTHTKIYATATYDGTCDYAIADDTQHVNVYTINPYTVNTLNNTVCYESTANLSAYSSLTPPYAVRWYNDYDHTDLVKEDSVYTTTATSSMVLPDLTEDKIFYIVVENDEYCPTTYGKPIHVLNMSNGETELSLGNTYRFYDSGGPSAQYGPDERLTHTFSSTDGKPVTIKFESFSFASNAHLYIFSGPDVNPDSMLYDLTYGSPNPGTIVSRGGDLTCYFISSSYSLRDGWSALVEHEPAKAIAKVRPKNEVTLYDTVCQSQSGTYSDPLHIAPAITSPESLNDVLRESGTHTFTNVLTGAGQYGCDSTVIFLLTVKRAPSHDTTVVITNVLHDGYFWHDSTYTTPGVHTYNIPLESGCDSLDILQLIIINIDTTADTTCLGTPLDITISANIRVSEDGPGGHSSYSTNHNICVGDVLCTDGTTMNPDKFLTSGKTAMGVVLQVDAEAGYGRAVALSGAYNTYTNESAMRWCYSGYSNINSLTQTGTLTTALSDMNGSGNTTNIVAKARSQNIEANLLNTAAYHCLYYNHATYRTGTDSLGWYMPSAGEMSLIYGFRIEINSTLSKLQPTYTGTTLLPSGTYWTSTEYNDNGFNWAWTVENGYIVGKDKWGRYHVRPLIKFQLP